MYEFDYITYIIVINDGEHQWHKCKNCPNYSANDAKKIRIKFKYLFFQNDLLTMIYYIVYNKMFDFAPHISKIYTSARPSFLFFAANRKYILFSLFPSRVLPNSCYIQNQRTNILRSESVNTNRL